MGFDKEKKQKDFLAAVSKYGYELCAQKILDWSKENNLTVRWGNAKIGAFTASYLTNSTNYTFFEFQARKYFLLHLSTLANKPPFDNNKNFDQLVDKLKSLEIELLDEKGIPIDRVKLSSRMPRIYLQSDIAKLEALFTAFNWMKLKIDNFNP